MDRWAAAQDAATSEARSAPACVFDDRRTRSIASWEAHASRSLLATAGDRLALEHMRWTEGDEALQLIEVDAEGRLLATILFDPEDRRAASTELERRRMRGDPAPWRRVLFEVQRGMSEHDLDRIRAALPDDFVFHDHRRAGPGLIEGADGYVAWLRPLFEESPDAMFASMYEVAAAEHGSVNVGHTIGTLRAGGAFDSAWVLLASARDGRLDGVELFELEDLETARARFEEFGRRSANVVRS